MDQAVAIDNQSNVHFFAIYQETNNQQSPFTKAVPPRTVTTINPFSTFILHAKGFPDKTFKSEPPKDYIRISQIEKSENPTRLQIIKSGRLESVLEKQELVPQAVALIN
jgi:hypothetical protein